MPITTWIRDLLGIPKDIIDLKKAKLEITKLEAEERQRNLITPASLDDVAKYDPKVQKLQREIEYRRKLGKGAAEPVARVVRRLAMDYPRASTFVMLIIIAGLIIAMVVAIIRFVQGT